MGAAPRQYRVAGVLRIGKTILFCAAMPSVSQGRGHGEDPTCLNGGPGARRSVHCQTALLQAVTEGVQRGPGREKPAAWEARGRDAVQRRLLKRVPTDAFCHNT